MIYISYNTRKEHQYYAPPRIIKRSVSFELPDPATWNEEMFLNSVWEHCGALCTTVVLRDVYRKPDETKRVIHNYDLFFQSGRKLASSYDITDLVIKVENDMVKLGAKFVRSHKPKGYKPLSESAEQ